MQAQNEAVPITIGGRGFHLHGKQLIQVNNDVLVISFSSEMKVDSQNKYKKLHVCSCIIAIQQ